MEVAAGNSIEVVYKEIVILEEDQHTKVDGYPKGKNCLQGNGALDLPPRHSCPDCIVKQNRTKDQNQIAWIPVGIKEEAACDK